MGIHRWPGVPNTTLLWWSNQAMVTDTSIAVILDYCNAPCMRLCLKRLQIFQLFLNAVGKTHWAFTRRTIYTDPAAASIANLFWASFIVLGNYCRSPNWLWFRILPPYHLPAILDYVESFFLTLYIASGESTIGSCFLYSSMSIVDIPCPIRVDCFSIQLSFVG